MRCGGSGRMQRIVTGGSDKTSGTAGLFSGVMACGIVPWLLRGELRCALESDTASCDSTGRLQRIVMGGEKMRGAIDLLRGIMACSVVLRWIGTELRNALGCGAARCDCTASCAASWGVTAICAAPATSCFAS